MLAGKFGGFLPVNEPVPASQYPICPGGALRSGWPSGQRGVGAEGGLGVSRQDPDALSHQVTAAAESMQQTEDTVNQLQHLTGLADQLAEPPQILEANLGKAVLRAR